METKEEKIKRVNEEINKIPEDIFYAKNKAQAEQDEKDFQGLKDALTQDKCYYCGNPLTHFSVHKPCFHWLLWRANGLRKKHFWLLFQSVSYHQLDAYLRWVANTDVPIRNINDLAEEKNPSKFIETTIKYRNLEWSFSCSRGDFQGHKDRREGRCPHYHFQMKRDGNIVINYNAFHISFNDDDDFYFAVERGEFDRIKAGHVHGAGMQTMMENFSPQEIIDSIKNAGDESVAQFRVQTLVRAEEGTTILGDDLVDIMKESKETGIPISKLIQKLKNVKIQSFISPGPAVPEIAVRKNPRGNNKDDSI